jgi:hypothetical protein
MTRRETRDLEAAACVLFSTPVHCEEQGDPMSNFGKKLRIGLLLSAIAVAAVTSMPSTLRAQDSQTGELRIGINSTVFIYNNMTTQAVQIMITVCLSDNSAPALVGTVFVVPVGGCRTARMTVPSNSGIGVTPSPAAAGQAIGSYQVREAL